MTAFTGDSLASYGGALNDYSPVVDPTTDRPAAGANPAYAATAGMTHTAIRAWARVTWNGTSLTLVSHDAIWGNSLAVAPTPAHSATGVATITWPANVQDEIQTGSPGYTGPLPLNLRAGFANNRGTTSFGKNVDITSANVATLRVFTVGTSTLADPGSATDFDVFVF